MIGHEYIGMHGTSMSCHRSTEKLQVEVAITVRMKTCGAVISTLNDMERYAGEV
jgi:hypothetical protein